jgi:predicted nucleotidyltransferase
MATMTLDELVKQLRSAYGEKLASVVLYGSAAGGDHIPNRSDYNVLVLITEFDNSELDRSTTVAAGHVARAWKDAGNPPPMTLTMEEWRRSADIFPMEYADILERHRVLHGDPPFEGIHVSKADLRLQLEQQVMGKLLQLRQGVLLAGMDGKRRTELIAASLSTMMVLFRAVLRLHGERPDVDNAAVAARVGALAGFDATPFTRAVRHVHGADKIPAAEAGRVLAGYLSAIDQLSHHLDGYDPT